jgi:hypothetical protein
MIDSDNDGSDKKNYKSPKNEEVCESDISIPLENGRIPGHYELGFKGSLHEIVKPVGRSPLAVLLDSSIKSVYKHSYRPKTHKIKNQLH